MAASPLPPFSPVLLGPDPREPNANAGKGYDTAEKVAALRKVLDVDGSPEHHRAHLSTVSLRRYLRARQGDVEKAAELARGSLRERVDESEYDLTRWNGRYNADPSTGARFCMLPLGRDRFGRGVLYGCPARASDADGEQTLHHICATLEAMFARGDALAARNLAAHKGDADDHAALAPSTWVWLVDFAGFGLVHATNPSIAIRLASAFSTRFPERLGAVVLIDAPWVFQILLGAIRAMLDEVTMSKIVTVSRASDTFRSQLESVLDKELTDWVVRACTLEPAEPGVLEREPDSGLRELSVLRGFLRARGAPLPPSEPADAHGDPGHEDAPWRDTEALSHGQAWELFVRAYDFEHERPTRAP